MYMTSNHRRPSGPGAGRLARVFAYCCAFVAVAIALAACGSTSSSTSSAAAAASSTSSSSGSATAASGTSASACVSQATQLVAKQKAPMPELLPADSVDMGSIKGKTVWYISPSQATGYALSVSQGLSAAGKAAGVNITIFDGKGEPTRFTQGVEQAVAQKAGGIILYGIDPALVPQGLLQAKAAKIPVVSVLTGKPSPSNGTVAEAINEDVTGGAKAMADYGAFYTGCKVDGATSFDPVYPSLVTEKETIKAELASLCPSTCKVQDHQMSLATMATALAPSVQNLIQRNSTLNTIFATFDQAATYENPAVTSSSARSRSSARTVWRRTSTRSARARRPDRRHLVRAGSVSRVAVARSGRACDPRQADGRERPAVHTADADVRQGQRRDVRRDPVAVPQVRQLPGRLHEALGRRIRRGVSGSIGDEVAELSNSDALRLTGISKRFGGVRALHDVEMSVPRGEVHGLVGANGSGKSTLVKILAGYHGPDEGRLEVWGKDVPLPIVDASRHGIATIHQDLGLIESLSIVENVVQTTSFGVEKGRPISWRQQRKRVAGLLDRLGIRLDPGVGIAALTRGERTLVAVARAICELEAGVVDDAEAEGRHLLIMDEPTAALSSTESGAVYALLRRVAAEGGAALFISHHVQEVRSLCAHITILRDGQVVGTVASAEASEADIVRGMLGAELARETPLEPEAPAEDGIGASAATRPAAAQPVLRVEEIQTALLQGMSFDVQPGEIVGITGLLGMGQDELPVRDRGSARTPGAERSRSTGGRWPVAICGMRSRPAWCSFRPSAGATGCGWRPAPPRTWAWPARVGTGATAAMTGRRSARSRASSRDRFGLRPRDPSILTNSLSGGNQQKVLLAKWLQLEPRVVLLHEPTQGVDIGAKLEIHRLVRSFAESAGAAVCVFSSDHDEVAELCDRAIVMSRGRAAGTIRRPELSTHRIVEMANEVTQS